MCATAASRARWAQFFVQSRDMNTLDTTLTESIIVNRVEFIESMEGSVTFQTQNGSILSAFFFQEKFTVGEHALVQFGSLDYPLEWTAIFSENKEGRQKLEPALEYCSYYAYGKIIALNPIVADFGDLKLSIGDWTHDEKVIGEFIYWKIRRLDITRLRPT
jgi:hypothetical protein